MSIDLTGGMSKLLHYYIGGKGKMITVLHGGEAQMITILYKGGGALGTAKNDYLICTQPLFWVLCVINRSAGCPKKVENRMMLEPKILTKIECSWAKFSHGYDLRALNPS